MNTQHQARQINRYTRAQGMVEFAMTLPVLLMLVLGIFEFGRLLFAYSSVISAAREAARYGAAGGVAESGARYYQDCDGIRDAAVRIGGLAGITNTTASVDIQYDKGPLVTDTIAVGCPVHGTGPFLSAGDRIVVTASTVFQPVQWFDKIPAITIRSVVRRTIIVNVDLN